MREDFICFQRNRLFIYGNQHSLVGEVCCVYDVICGYILRITEGEKLFKESIGGCRRIFIELFLLSRLMLLAAKRDGGAILLWDSCVVGNIYI